MKEKRTGPNSRVMVILAISLLFAGSCTFEPKEPGAEEDTKQEEPAGREKRTTWGEQSSRQKFADLEKHLKESHASSMMILVNGEVVFEWGSTRRKHLVHSIRKALLNSLYGIAIEKGQIDTSMTIRELGIDDIDPGLSDNEKDARIADLLKSRSGIYHQAAAVSRGMLVGMPRRDAFGPGEHYYYNNWDFNVLGSILERQTGRSLYELFMDQIAGPLGMKDYRGRYALVDGEKEGVEMPDTDGFYQFESSKSLYPAYHFRLSARDLALYGQLYLNMGSWKGRQIIPAGWIAASTRPYSVYNREHGLAYGMLWKVVVREEGGTSGPAGTGDQNSGRSSGHRESGSNSSSNSDGYSDSHRNAFFHTGAGIHMLAIYPDRNMVVVHRVDTENRNDYDGRDFYKMLDLLFKIEV